MIYKLIIQELSSDEDGNIHDKIDIGITFNNLQFGYYSSIENVKKAISNIIPNRIQYGGHIINIFTRDIIENTDNNGEYENYTFFDIKGNILSSVIDEEIRDSINKYKVGDLVLFIGDLDECDVNMEIGIISMLPSKLDNEYTVLLGKSLHNHIHVVEEFLHLYNTDEVSYMIQVLNDRLKIGY